MAGGGVFTGGGLGGTESPRGKATAILLTTFSAFGGILFGYDTGTINGIKIMPDWLCTFGTDCAISTSQQSLVVSILSAGTFFGALLGAPVADIVGRKPGLIVSCLVFSVGVALQTAATRLPLFVVGRVIAGLGVGLVSTLVPLYQSECSPKWIRGAVVSCYQWFITVGLLLAAIIDNATQARTDHASYRIPIAMQFIWATILAIGMVFLPESPRLYVRRGQRDKAAKALAYLLSCSPTDDLIHRELADIQANLIAEEQMAGSGWLAMFTPGPSKILFRTFVGTSIQAWQQLTGINFINYYGTTFFQNSGIPNPFLISIATNLMNVGFTVVGGLAVDRYGRRILLLSGAAVMLICEFLIAIIAVTISVSNASGQKALVALVCIYIAGFGFSWGPVAWVVVGEIFPLNFRAKGVALSAASNWLWNFALGYATPYLVDSGTGNADLGPKVFFIWGATCTAAFLFVFFFVPETKGLSLEQVDILIQHSTPLKSDAYRRQILEQNLNAFDASGHAIAHAGPRLSQEEKVTAGNGDVVPV